MNELITIKLTASQWNSILTILQEVSAPHKITHPLIQEIFKQCNEQVSQQPPAAGE